MKLLLPTAAFLAAVHAGTISLDMVRRSNTENIGLYSRQHARHLEARKTHTAQMRHESGVFYSVNATVGNPPQKVTLLVDTGSTDTFILTTNGTCAREDANCLTPFDPDQSSTLTRVTQEELTDDSFLATFVDKTFAQGVYAKDDFTVGDVTIPQLIIGVGDTSNTTEGILGLAFDDLEGSNDRKTSSETYPSFLTKMAATGAISRRVFSMSLGAATGNLLFGGIDTERFYDDLAKIPITERHFEDDGTPGSYSVLLDDFTAKGISPEIAPFRRGQVAILDSGTTDTVLPKLQAVAIANALGAVGKKNDTGSGNNQLVDCKRRNENVTLDFVLGGKKVYIPIANFIADEEFSKDELNNMDDAARAFSKICTLRISSAENVDGLYFGDSFLRSVYVVHDVDNKMIGLAQANLQSTKSNIIEIGAKDPIPNAKGAALPDQVVKTGRDGPQKNSNDKTSAADSMLHVPSVGFAVVVAAILFSI